MPTLSRYALLEVTFLVKPTSVSGTDTWRLMSGNLYVVDESAAYTAVLNVDAIINDVPANVRAFLEFL